MSQITKSLKVILQSKSRIVHYIARVDVIDGDECEGVHQTISTFMINDKDEASFPKKDIIRKLPEPQ